MTMRPVLIAGPTASGKSAMALSIARSTGGMVINADSQQVYRDWRVLTARPSLEEEAQAPHRLYGHIALDQDYSVGHWLREVAPILAQSTERPIIVGGTGLYFKALTEGLAPIPAVPPDIRAEGEAQMARLGTKAFADAFAARDPQTAAMIDTINPSRVLRAWEVLEATGEGLAAWTARTPAPLVPLSACTAIALTPARDWLYARCEARFDAMLKAGALDEVEAVMALNLPETAPGLRALGAPELTDYLCGLLTLEEAKVKAKTETRRYAKRQMTWIRNQMAAWSRLDPAASDATEKALAMV